MSPFQQELLEYLRRKQDPIGLGRIVADFKRPQPEIVANLDSLRRLGLARVPRPGEWTANPEPAPGHETIPPAPPPPPARDVTGRTPPPPPPNTTAGWTPFSRLQVPVHAAPAPSDQEADMSSATKVCNECEKRKPTSDFYASSAKCKPCYNARQAKLKAAREGKAEAAAPAAAKRQGGGPPEARRAGERRAADARRGPRAPRQTERRRALPAGDRRAARRACAHRPGDRVAQGAGLR